MPLQVHPPETPDASPPPRPPHFDQRYELPAHREMPLHTLNKHALDARMEFLEEPHVYLFDGRPCSDSVTGVAHKYQTPFDADAAIGMMKGSKKERWPRLKYTRNPRRMSSMEEVSASIGVLIVDASGLTVSVVQPHNFGPETTSEQILENLQLLRIAKTFKRTRDDESAASEDVIYLFERAMTDDEIKASWEANGMDARNRGTEAHLQMQLYAEGQPYRPDDEEVVIGLRYFDRISDDWEAYRCEWEIVYPEADLAGSIDLVIRNRKTNRFAVIDYKRSDKLSDRLIGYGRMKGDMAHLEDCDGAAYALQLSIYQYVLEHVYGLQVDDRILLSLHPDKPFCTSVPYLEKEVEHIMAQRRETTRVRAQCPYRCKLSDRSLHDAVVIELDGAMLSVDGKTALVRGHEKIEDDHQMRTIVDEWVNARIDKNLWAEYDTAKMPRWRSMMPKTGIQPPLMQNC